MPFRSMVAAARPRRRLFSHPAYALGVSILEQINLFEYGSGSVGFYDRYLFTVSQHLDRLFKGSFGKNLLTGFVVAMDGHGRTAALPAFEMAVHSVRSAIAMRSRSHRTRPREHGADAAVLPRCIGIWWVTDGYRAIAIYATVAT
jgi:hypothetical protein